MAESVLNFLCSVWNGIVRSRRILAVSAALALCVSILAVTLVWYIRDFHAKCAVPVSSAEFVSTETDS